MEIKFVNQVKCPRKHNEVVLVVTWQDGSEAITECMLAKHKGCSHLEDNQICEFHSKNP